MVMDSADLLDTEGGRQTRQGPTPTCRRHPYLRALIHLLDPLRHITAAKQLPLDRLPRAARE